MLKRTLTLVSLTITLGTLLLALGCGGSNNNPIAPVSSDQVMISRGENVAPSAPILVRPNGMKIVYVRDGKIRFVVSATDENGDKLKYRIVLKKNGETVAVFDQTQNPTGWNKPEYSSGEYAILAVSLSPGSYEWNAQAFDGSVWGPFHNPDATFTYAP